MRIIPRRREGGHVLVESSLTLLAFMAVVICIFDFAQLFFIHQGIVERVRAALRYGVAQEYDPTSIKNMVLYNQPTQPAGGATSFSLNPNSVVIARFAQDTPEDRIVVTITEYPYEFLSPFLAGRRSAGPLVGVMGYEGLQ